MDWEKVRSPAKPAADAPSATLVELCWHVRSASTGRVISCGIYGDSAPGLDVRAQFSDDDLLRTKRARDLSSAQRLAEEWRRAVLAKGSFVEIEGNGTT